MYLTSRWLPPRPAADYINASVDTLQAWRSAGKGPPWSKVGRLVRYRIEDLDAFLNAHRREPIVRERAK